MPTFTRKPYQIEAFQYGSQPPQWFIDLQREDKIFVCPDFCRIDCMGIYFMAKIGDYVVKDEVDMIYAMPQYQFREQFELYEYK